MPSMNDLKSLHLVFNEVRGIDPDLPVSYPAALVLIATAEKEGHNPKVGDVIEGLGMMPSTVSRMVASLERHKLVLRKKDRVDARTTRIHMAKRGQELLDRMLGHREPQAKVEDWAPHVKPLNKEGFAVVIDRDRQDALDRLGKLEAEMESLKGQLTKK